MILFLHSRYRTTGGEERAVASLQWLVREHLSEDAEVLERDSASLTRMQAATGLLGGGLHSDQVARAVRRTGARIVHVHNLHPSLGWRALAAARDAGARVVMHLHQYRLVCAIGVCYTEGADCVRCHGRNTLPGVIHNCRGTRGESLAYASALALWQRRIVAHVDAFVVPSQAALERLRALGAPVRDARVIGHVIREFAPAPAAASPASGYALLATRLAPEKGVDIAIEACRLAGVPLIIAGDGPERARLEGIGGVDVTFLGRVDDAELARLRHGAALALAPSRSAETFGVAAAEAMAAGLPVAGSRIGALAELLPEPWLARPGDPASLARVISSLRSDRSARSVAIARVRALAAPEKVAPALAALYAEVCERS